MRRVVGAVRLERTQIMDHKNLVHHAVKQLHSWGCCPVVSELVTCNSTGEIPDAIGWTCRASILFECKVSRADFSRDRGKLFRFDLPDHGMGDWRFYLTNPGVVRSADELPPGWGCYEIAEGEDKKVRLLHKFGIKYRWTEPSPLRGDKDNEITMLRSIIRRIDDE